MAADDENKVVVLHALGNALRTRGPAADLDELGDAAGLPGEVVRLHFPKGRQALVGEVLQTACEEFDEVVTEAMTGAPTPKEALQEAADGLAAYYEGGARHCLFELFSVPQDATHLPALRAVTARFQQGLKGVFLRLGDNEAEAERRALKLLAELHGTLVLGRLTGDETLFRAFTDQLPSMGKPVTCAG